MKAAKTELEIVFNKKVHALLKHMGAMDGNREPYAVVRRAIALYNELLEQRGDGRLIITLINPQTGKTTKTIDLA